MKNFLLIVYVIGFLFTQQCMGARSNTISQERSGDSGTSLFFNSISKAGDCSFYCKAGFFITDIDSEDDGELKAKIISTGDLLFLYVDLCTSNKIELIQYATLEQPMRSRALFKLNQVFRL